MFGSGSEPVLLECASHTPQSAYEYYRYHIIMTEADEHAFISPKRTRRGLSNSLTTIKCIAASIVRLQRSKNRFICIIFRDGWSSILSIARFASSVGRSGGLTTSLQAALDNQDGALWDRTGCRLEAELLAVELLLAVEVLAEFEVVEEVLQRTHMIGPPVPPLSALRQHSPDSSQGYPIQHDYHRFHPRTPIDYFEDRSPVNYYR